MGKRGASETLTSILHAFMRQPTWTQADLARAVGVQVPALKKQLENLETTGFPLEREFDHPHVYWSVPKSWFPGGVIYIGEDIESLLRTLARAPSTKERDRLIEAAARCLGQPSRVAIAAKSIRTRPVPRSEDSAQRLVEDSARKAVVVRCRYYTQHSGSERWRDLSVQRVYEGAPTRFVAWFHEAERLKWYRVDGVLDAELSDSERYAVSSEQEVDDFVAHSVAGYFEAERPGLVCFDVREPEARWVVKNLPEGMRAEVRGTGVRVSAKTAAITTVARFVVGLGGAAIPITPSLSYAVRGLAEGALGSLTGPE